MAESMWIKMDGCKGEATDAKHKDEIDVDSYSWGLSHPVDPSGSGQSAGESTASALVVSKTVDIATPNLMKFCMNAKTFPTVLLTCRKRGTDPVEYLKITMKNTIVSSVQTSAAGEGSPAQESVAFSFTAVEVEYTPQSDEGAPGGAVKATWDFAKNQE